MGVAVESLAVERGHEIVTRFNRRQPLQMAAQLSAADVGIDFTLPDAASSHIEVCIRAGIPVVVGTTGWYEGLTRIKELVRCEQGAVLYSPNFSLGIQLTRHALRAAIQLLNHLPDYDVAIHEVHHTRKVDQPSGTAINLAETILEGLQRKSRWAADAKGDPRTLGITSQRVGTVFGRHEVIMDSPADQMTISHHAKSRAGFAAGAITAAEWICDRTGLFTLEDMLSDWASA